MKREFHRKSSYKQKRQEQIAIKKVEARKLDPKYKIEEISKDLNRLLLPLVLMAFAIFVVLLTIAI